MKAFDHSEIEPKWQRAWAEQQLYRTTEDPDKEKYYILDMFPYPSGAGLHVGHPKGYIATDIISRYKKMNGCNVLHPMGWDAFGLPAEQYALKNKVHPRKATEENIATFKAQLEQISLNYDWEREIATTDPSFYKWTQWTFIQMFKHGLVYRSHEPINWCPSCKTGLANEDLEEGLCERCGSVIEKRPFPQWMIRITDYADRLLDDLDQLDWQAHIKELQRNWIGKSEGATITFSIAHTDLKIPVFTTRADTLFGATYLVLAPEHKEVTNLKSQISNWDEVESYRAATEKRTEIERTAEKREKTGVQLQGVAAVNPATREEIPVYISDYVLAHYGTGALMAVPAHDERDYAFAKAFDLPIRQVIAPETGTPHDSALRRDGGCAVIFDPAQQKYAVAHYPDGRFGLYGGGREGDESVEEGILREVREESGFHNFAHIEEIASAHAHYFNAAKKARRVAHATCLLLILEDTDQLPLELSDHEDFELAWVSPDEIYENWDARDPGDGGRDHWYWFVRQAVGRSIEAGYDTVHERTTYYHEPFTGEGRLINSDAFSEMKSEEARAAITEHVGGELTSTYKLRDWVFSRQRYWGEPIPLIHCETCDWVPVPEDQLPLTLPKVESYEPTGTGESPLAAIEEWVNTQCPECGGTARRETNTMPQWAGSSWYYLRFIDPHNDEELVDKSKDKYWSPVDFYVGGAEHATRHLIYARFWHKFLFDIGVVNYDEPFTKLQTVGLIMAEDGRKMSKRWGNVISPDDVIANVGADSLRVYEMFMGPFDQAISWNTDNLIGARKWLERVWRLQEKIIGAADDAVETELHRTIKKVGEDIEALKLNTAISQMMTFTNLAQHHGITREQYAILLQLLAPFAPHLAEELWREVLGHETSVHLESWPAYDDTKLVAETVSITVQVNGKTRGSVTAPHGSGEDDIVAAAREDPQIAKWVSTEPERVVFVPNRLVNFVIPGQES